MPQVLGRRYYRQSDTHGLEVQIVSKGTEAGWWVAVLPDHSVVEIPLSHKKTISSAPIGGVTYSPMPVLTNDVKQATIRRAQDKVRLNNIKRMRKIGAGGHGHFGELRRFLTILTGLPILSGRLARWALRSKRRFGSAVCSVFVVYEAASNWGVFEWLNRKTETFTEFYRDVRDKISDSSEVVGETITTIESMYGAVTDYIEPWRLLAYFVTALMMLWFW